MSSDTYDPVTGRERETVREMGIKGKKPKRNFHHKAKPVKVTADEDRVARMTATLFTAAAARVLRDKYGWTEEATTQFGDEMVEDAQLLAETLNTRGRALEARQAATSGYAQANGATGDDAPAVTAAASSAGDNGWTFVDAPVSDPDGPVSAYAGEPKTGAEAT